MKAEELHQEIAKQLAAIAPSGWRAAYVDARLLEDVGEAKLYSSDKLGATRKRFDPSMDWFDAIDQLLQRLRRVMSQASGNAWSEAFVTLESTGRLSFKFGYGDAQPTVQRPTDLPSAGPRP
jgi:hypothetical protein